MMLFLFLGRHHAFQMYISKPYILGIILLKWYKILWETKSNVHYFVSVSLLIVLLSISSCRINIRLSIPCSLLLFLHEKSRFKMKVCFPYSVIHGIHSLWYLSNLFGGTFLVELLNFGRLRSSNAVGKSVEAGICINSTDSSISWYTGSICWERWFDCFVEVLFKYILLMPFGGRLKVLSHVWFSCLLGKSKGFLFGVFDFLLISITIMNRTIKITAPTPARR